MPSKNSLEDDDTTSTAAAATNSPPSTGVRPHTRALGPTPPLDTLVDNLFKMLDDRFTKMDDRFAELTSSMDKGEKRQVESMSHLEDRLLAKIEAFNGQIGDLRTNAIDHERRINDQDQRINKLKSNLLKLESVHKGYKDTNNELIATLRTDVNNTRAKIPELRREVQDSAVELRQEYQDSTAGLATSIKEVAALIPDLHQQQQEPQGEEEIQPKNENALAEFFGDMRLEPEPLRTLDDFEGGVIYRSSLMPNRKNGTGVVGVGYGYDRRSVRPAYYLSASGKRHNMSGRAPMMCFNCENKDVSDDEKYHWRIFCPYATGNPMINLPYP
jgi:predicted  nucleic acid-binding Zn-ribbon protein